MDIGNLNQEILNLENDIREVEEEIEVFEGHISNLENLKHSLQKQLREKKNFKDSNCNHETIIHSDDKVICSDCNKVLPNQMLLSLEV